MVEPKKEGRLSALLGLHSDDGAEISRGMVLTLVIAVATLIALALLLVWLNIERTKLAYRVRILQHTLTEKIDTAARLNVEREHLLSPHQLGKQAEKMGLGPAKPGQIRRIGNDNEGPLTVPAAGTAGR